MARSSPTPARRPRSATVGSKSKPTGQSRRRARPAVESVDLLARLRHDLCTPASHIQGYAEMLQEEAVELGCEDWRPDLKHIEEAGRRLVEVVREALAPERVARAALDLRQIHADLRTPLNHVIGYGEILLEQAESSGRVKLIPDLNKILSAARTFLAMLAERLTADAPGLRTGVGGISSSGTGTGAASTSLPVLGAVAAEGGLALSRPPVHGPVSAPVTGRVLVIEDDRQNRELLSRRLLRQGFEVVTEASGRGGLRRARAESFDLVLLDLIMPGLGGDRVLAEFKSDPVLRELPVIMLSAVDAVDAVVRCILMGAEDYLAKPFNPVLLRARIAACLEKVRLRRQEQATQRALEVERQKSEELLLNILPRPIAVRLKAGEVTIVDSLPEVTVLFADLVGFTELASRIDSVEMVRLLDEVFSGFDVLAKSQGLEKIKTIGDAYMVVGGLPTPRPDHAEAIAELALDMLRQVERQSVQLGHSIRLRLGIHTGPVIAGIIGRQKFSYDLWGDTVNTASRMESHGLPGLIQVTDEVHERLRHAYRFEPRGSIAVKGKGAMNTWMLAGRLTP